MEDIEKEIWREVEAEERERERFLKEKHTTTRNPPRDNQDPAVKQVLHSLKNGKSLLIYI